MSEKDWAAAWTSNQIGFHQSKPSTYLERFADDAFGAEVGRVFVPLCGKSLDLVFLADRATDVIGVEFVEQAVQDFFDERGLTPTVLHDPETQYQADNYTLFAADFFAMTPELLGPIDAVVDRASMVALIPETRERYATHMASLLRAGAKILLITFTYDQQMMHGPPHSVPADEIQSLYADNFTVEHLDTRDALDGIFRSQGLTLATESAHLLTRT
jgi:thiopurine S-methyltransferase